MVLAPILGVALWLRLSRWVTFALGGGTVLFFVVLTGAEPSVMRAGVMAGLSLFGVLPGRSSARQESRKRVRPVGACPKVASGGLDRPIVHVIHRIHKMLLAD